MKKMTSKIFLIHKLCFLIVFVYLVLLGFFPYIKGIRIDIFYSYLVLPLLFLICPKKSISKEIIILNLIFISGLLFSSFLYIFIYDFGTFNLVHSLININGMLRFLLLLIVFDVLFKNINDMHRKILLRIIILIISFFIVMALLQIYYPFIRNITIDYYTSGFNTTVERVLNKEYFIRPVSILQHPSAVGLTVLIAYMFLLNYCFYGKIRNKILIIILLFFLIFMGIKSYSKIFYLGFFIYNFYFLIINKKFKMLLTTSIVLIIGILLLFFIYKDILMENYLLSLLINKGIFAFFETRYGSDGFLTSETDTLSYIINTNFCGTGIFSIKNVFYGDSLYTTLILRLSVYFTLIFLIYSIVVSYIIRKNALFWYELFLSDLFFIIMLTGVGMTSLYTTRLSEIFAILFAYAFFLKNKRKELYAKA